MGEYLSTNDPRTLMLVRRFEAVLAEAMLSTPIHFPVRPLDLCARIRASPISLPLRVKFHPLQKYWKIHPLILRPWRKSFVHPYAYFLGCAFSIEAASDSPAQHDGI